MQSNHCSKSELSVPCDPSLAEFLAFCIQVSQADDCLPPSGVPSPWMVFEPCQFLCCFTGFLFRHRLTLTILPCLQHLWVVTWPRLHVLALWCHEMCTRASEILSVICALVLGHIGVLGIDHVPSAVPSRLCLGLIQLI